MRLWDTSGDERFRSVINLYYKDAIGAIICYDIGDDRSFNAVNYWVNQMQQNCTSPDGEFLLALVGNKCDLPESQKKMKSSDAHEMAKAHDMIWAEVSAKTGEGIDHIFDQINERVFEIR